LGRHNHQRVGPIWHRKTAGEVDVFNNEFPYTLGTVSDDILLGVDFNSVHEANDSAGHRSFNRSLAALVRGNSLSDAWQTNLDRLVYTHYTIHDAAKLVRFYLSDELFNGKKRIETLAAVFTEHLAVVLRLSMDTPL
jgi:hypothetical protein